MNNRVGNDHNVINRNEHDYQNKIIKIISYTIDRYLINSILLLNILFKYWKYRLYSTFLEYPNVINTNNNNNIRKTKLFIDI